MQNQTNGEIISRVKGELRKITPDNRLLTNKFIFSLLCKWRDLFVQRADSKNKILSIPYIYQTLPEEELIEVDKVRAKCSAIKSGLTIKRTKRELPAMINGYSGPIIREVSSIDGSILLTETTRSAFIKKVNSPNFKYNKEIYFWYEDGHLWFPTLEWDTVMISAYFRDDIDELVCDECGPIKMCKSYLDHQFRIPSNVVAEMEQQIINEQANLLKIPSDESINKNDN